MKRTMKIGNAITITFDDAGMHNRVFESTEDWRAEGERRFGKNLMKWKFRCPMCGHVAAVQEFDDLGVKDPFNSAYQECLGRYMGKGSPKEGEHSGCNWTANGFRGIPKGGTYVFTGEDTGAHIFDFAEKNE